MTSCLQLQQLHCAHCGGVTLHTAQRCLHCQTQQPRPLPPLAWQKELAVILSRAARGARATARHGGGRSRQEVS